MKTFLSTIGAIALVLIAIAGLGVLIFGGNWVNYQSAKQVEGYKYDIFKTSKESVQGTIQELDKIRTEYLGTKDPDQKGALGARAKRLSRDTSPDNLPDDIRSWLETL